MEGVEAENQTPVLEGNTQGVRGASGTAAAAHLQQVDVRFLPEAGLLGSGGCGAGLISTPAPCLQQQMFLFFCSLNSPPSAENGRTAFIPDISATSNLGTCGLQSGLRQPETGV